MKKLLKLLPFILILTALTVSAAPARAAYSEEYSALLQEFYECLDTQAAEFEKSEEQRVIFRFPDFKVENRDSGDGSSIAYNNALKIITLICAKRPALFSSMNFTGTLYPTQDPSTLTGISLKQLTFDRTYAETYAEMDARINEILDDIIDEDMSDLDKAFAVYTYLLNNCTIHTDRSVPERETSYGAIMCGFGACGGFANAFQIFMDRLGIPCETVFGKNEQHIWNYVQIEGQWYQVDATWGTSGGKTYKYFLMSDTERTDGFSEESILEHDWDSIHTNVVCDANCDGYLFRRMPLSSVEYKAGAYFYEYDGDMFTAQSLKPVTVIMSLPKSYETDQIASVSDMTGAYSKVYGGSIFNIVTVCYDADGNMVDFEIKEGKRDSTRIIDVSCDGAENAAYVKVFIWDDELESLIPLSETVTVR